MISLILQSPALADLFKRFTENKVFKSCGDGPWEHRLEATPDALRAIEDSIPNRLSLLLATYSRFKDLQVKLSRVLSFYNVADRILRKICNLCFFTAVWVELIRSRLL